ncbi:AAA family ATPase [Corynebacterium pelargi]|uniref:Chromosome segregation protein n=1 Tax=Corynebacterium pelargi TaxID=1471400 RepID=A0A410W9K0_9CORY|nr:AAA family ATPase [Corynebacterium pelargi]QAU52616.1 chromosome segregation protein [Corynebacterium pelargi]GGG77683.1 hypothetical protein GCM10007338_14460 [Corynebacterium pelargi]
MIFHKIHIHNAAKVAEFKLEDIPNQGVVVIDGENEAGKSTIIELIRHALFTKSTSKGKDIEAFRPLARDEGPEISLELTMGQHRLLLHKRWLKKPVEELKALEGPLKGQQWTSTEAANRLEALVKGEANDPELFEALFVSQEKLDADMKAAGIPSLQAMLNHDDADAFDEDTELLAKLGKRYSATFTATGRPKAGSSLQTAIKAVEEAEEWNSTASDQFKQIEARVDLVDKTKPEILALEQRLPQAEKELQAKEQEYRSMKQAQDELEALKQRHADALALLEAAKRELEQRKELKQSLEQHELQCQELEEERKGKAALQQQEQRKVEEVAAALKACREQIAHLSSSIEQRSAALRLIEQNEELQRLREQRAQLEKLEKQQLSLESVPNVTQAMVDAVADAQAALRSARAVNESQSAQLRLNAQAPTDIALNGQEHTVDQEQRFAVTEAIELEIGGVEISVEPGAGSEASAQAVKEAERALEQALQDTPAKDVEQLRELRTKREDAETALHQVRLERAGILGQREESEVSQRLAELELALQGVDIPEQCEDDREALGEELQALQAEETGLVERREALSSRPAQRALDGIEAKVEHAQALVQGLAKDVEKAESKQPTEELEQQLSQRVATCEELQGSLEQAGLQVDAFGGEKLASEFEQSKAEVHNIQQDIAKKTALIEVNQSEIDAQSGVAEQAQQAERALQAARQRLAVEQRDADAVKLLYEVLQRHRNEARERYARPLGQKLSQLAPYVYGSEVEFEFDQNLSVTARSSQDGHLALERLSVGAREQLAVLIRIALAMIAGGEDTSLVLDDPLGASDPARIGSMSALLAKMAEKQQVIIMTCQPERFQKVPGRQAHSLAELARYY